MNKKIVKAVVIIVVIMLVGIGIGVYILNGQYVTTKCETDLYSVEVSKQWNVDEPFVDMKRFLLDENEVAFIEIFRDCSYNCASAESIAVNAFGIHGSLLDSEETTLGDWTRYKMVIGYELSPAQQIKGEATPASEVHYIYTNKQDTFVDIYVNEKLLTDDEIQKFLESFEMK